VGKEAEGGAEQEEQDIGSCCHCSTQHTESSLTLLDLAELIRNRELLGCEGSGVRRPGTYRPSNNGQCSRQLESLITFVEGHAGNSSRQRR
jgi:hypothetical protein